MSIANDSPVSGTRGQQIGIITVGRRQKLAGRYVWIVS
jgi:hypothetical protein